MQAGATLSSDGQDGCSSVAMPGNEAQQILEGMKAEEVWKQA